MGSWRCSTRVVGIISMLESSTRQGDVMTASRLEGGGCRRQMGQTARASAGTGHVGRPNKRVRSTSDTACVAIGGWEDIQCKGRRNIDLRNIASLMAGAELLRGQCRELGLRSVLGRGHSFRGAGTPRETEIGRIHDPNDTYNADCV